MRPLQCRLVSVSLAAWLLIPGLSANAATQTREPDTEALAKAAAKAAGQFQPAIEAYRRALAQNPAWWQGWESLGMLLADRGEYAQAHEAFETLVKLQPKRGDAWVLLGICEFRLGQYDPAVGHLEKARTFDITDKVLLRLLYYYSAAIMILRGDFDTAQVRLLLLSREGVTSDELMEAYGLAALRIPTLPGQEPPAMRGVALEVGRLVTRSRHMTVEESREGFEKLIAKYPNLAGLQYAYGKYLASHTLFREACEAFKAELRNSPRDATTRLQIAAIQSQQLNQPKEALPLAEEAAQLAPGLFAGHFVLGRILLKLGETDRAVTELETAAKLAPDSVMIHHVLLTAYNKANRREDAAREQEALRRLQEFEAKLKGQGSENSAKGAAEGGQNPPASTPP